MRYAARGSKLGCRPRGGDQVSDKFARVLTGLAVLAVAVIAAAVSFSHIRALALTHGYSPDTGALLPFSVDGLLVVSSLVLLAEARAQRPARGLPASAWSSASPARWGRTSRTASTSVRSVRWSMRGRR